MAGRGGLPNLSLRFVKYNIGGACMNSHCVRSRNYGRLYSSSGDSAVVSFLNQRLNILNKWGDIHLALVKLII